MASLNAQGIAVPIQNQAQPTTAPQAVQTQTGTVYVDPLTLEETNAAVASAGASSVGQLINQLPPSLRLELNSLPPTIGQALLENAIANRFIAQNQQMGGLNAIPATTDVAVQLPGQTMSLAQAQGVDGAGIAQTLPQSPMLANNPNPAIQAEYQTIQQLLNAGAIDIPTYYSIVQSLLQQSLQPTTTSIQQAPTNLAYAVPQKKGQQVGVLA